MIGFSLALLGVERGARADTPIREVVVLHDGSIVQGELVEKIVSDHVTVKLADGRVRTIAWKDVEEARDDSSPAASLPDAFGDTTPAETPPAADDRVIVNDWPEPDREASAFEPQHLMLGVFGGTASGIAGGRVSTVYGVSVERDLTRWLGFELDASDGSAGEFGATLSQRIRFGLPIGNHLRVGLGYGVSEAKTGAELTDVGAPSWAWFFVGGGFLDYAPTRHLLVRAEGESGLLMNRSGFCEVGSTPMPVSACEMADPINNNNEAISGRFSVRVGVSWMFDL